MKHIALYGPAMLSDLQPYVFQNANSAGLQFPLLPAVAAEYISRVIKTTVITSATDSIQYLYRDLLDNCLVLSRSIARDHELDFFKKERFGIKAELIVAQPDLIHPHWASEFEIGASWKS